MFNILLLLVLTCAAKAAWHEGNPSNPKLVGGGGGNSQDEARHRQKLQQIIVPTNPPSHNPTISIGLNQNSIDVVDLRGTMEAQNIDVGGGRGCFERLMQTISSWCGSRSRTQPLTPIRAPTPPRLFRTNSIYPGR